MKKIILCLGLSLFNFFNAQQTTIWSENFNAKDLSSWTIINANGDSTEFGENTWDTSQYLGSDFTPLDTPFLRGDSYTTANGIGHLNPDDWAITPVVDLTNVASGRIVRLNWALVNQPAGFTPSPNGENYSIYVATTNTVDAMLAGGVKYNESNVPISYTTRLLDVSQYIGQKIYIGFRQHNIDNSITPGLSSAIGIDDVKVSSILLSACNGTAPESLAVSQITQTTAKVDWDPKTDATYLLRYKKVSSSTWTEVPLTVYSYTINNLDKDTNYDVQVAAICSGTIGTFSSKIFKTLGFCSVSASDSSFEYISKIVISPANGGNVMTSNSDGNNYTDYSTDSSRLIQLSKGSTGNTISVTKTWAGNQYNEGVAVWLDFNNDKIFDLSEKIASTEANQEPTTTVSFNVPENAYFGDELVRMRVALRYDQTPNNPCESYNYGEVEDYGVKISEFLAVDNFKVNDLKVYPNPVKDILTINTARNIQKLEIYNMTGQEILSKKALVNSKIDMTSLRSGAYIVRITIDGSTTDFKVIKE